MSAFDTYIGARDSALRNGERARAEGTQNALLGARQTAGAAIAGGDYAGGANALYGAGDLSSGMAVQDQQRQISTADLAAKQAAQERQRHALVAGAQGLRYLPADQRWTAYQTRVLPHLQSEGLGPDILGQISQDHMNDADLDSVIAMAGGEVQRPTYQGAGNGQFMRSDPYGGGQPEFIQAPVSEYEQQKRAAELEAIQALAGQRRASGQAATTRAARSGRSGGGSSSGGRPATSSAPAGRPWERSW